jgi:hypothetical protein
MILSRAIAAIIGTVLAKVIGTTETIHHMSLGRIFRGTGRFPFLFKI